MLEEAIATKRQAARDAKAAYETAVTKRSLSQRDVNDLLQRKSTWDDQDVSRFTSLVRQDHIFEQEEARAKEQVELAEADVESEFNELMRTILNRYHEEQVWSDKIRSASTYGSFLVLGVNVFVFIVAIVIVEPWKRKRLAETFEKRIEQLSLENRTMIAEGMNNLATHFEKQENVLIQLTARGETPSSTPIPVSEAVIEEDIPTTSPPVSLLERTAKAAKALPEMWIMGALGAIGGSSLTLLLSYYR